MSRTARPESYSLQQVQIGRRIRQVREFSGKTKAEIAKAVNVDPSTLSKIEDGLRSPSVFLVAELAIRMHVTTDYLLRGDLSPLFDPEMRVKIQVAGEAALAREHRQRRKGLGTDTAQASDKSRKPKTLAPTN